MPEFWESSFIEKEMMWGNEPTLSAGLARDLFHAHGAQNILIPGIGYGRNAKVFLDQGMQVTGIEISKTAIDLMRSKIGLDIPVHHGSVNDMPFDGKTYDGIFSFALIHLLSEPERKAFIENCHRQLKPGGHMIFTTISKKAPQYGVGKRVGNETFEMPYGVTLLFYDEGTIREEFGKYGLLSFEELEEPATHGDTRVGLPFLNIVCRKPPDGDSFASGDLISASIQSIIADSTSSATRGHTVVEKTSAAR
jgi:SAM-dependent methyltransferase